MPRLKNALEERADRESYLRRQVENLIGYAKAAYAEAETQSEKDDYRKSILAMEGLLALPSILPEENF